MVFLSDRVDAAELTDCVCYVSCHHRSV